jgi:putative spermidine/putrescine transport system substrate-binding protein
MNWPLATLWGISLKEEISDAFTAHTGISVYHHENVGLDFPKNLIEALQKKKRPPFDVIYGNVVPAAKLAQAGLCSHLDEEELPVLKELAPRAKPEAKGLSGWPFVNLYVVRYALMFRDSKFPGGAPESWSVLCEPRFSGKVSIYPGGKGFYPIAQIMGGGALEDIPNAMEACWNFIRELKPNLGPKGYNKQMTEHIKRGDVDLFFTALTNIRQWKESGIDVSWAVPREGTADCEDSLIIPGHLPDNVLYWARQYIAFALSRDIQKNFCHRLAACPMHLGIEPPEELKDSPAYPVLPDDLTNVLYVPDSVTVEHEEHWIGKFNDIIQ